MRYGVAAAVFGDLEGDRARAIQVKASEELSEKRRGGERKVRDMRRERQRQRYRERVWKRSRKKYKFEREDQFWQSNQIRKSADLSTALPLHFLLSIPISLLSSPVSPFLSPRLTFLSPSQPPEFLRQSFYFLLVSFSFAEAITLFCLSLIFPVELANG